jgi:hypothetical protein
MKARTVPSRPSPSFTRPDLERTGPRRSAGHFYRAASDNPDVRGGVPLDSLEAAATAAVRLGYRIASAQVDRTARLTRRLREEGDRAAGPDSPRQALDATEELIFRAFMNGLGWLEGVAADRRSPLKRLGSAQYRLLGALLGLVSPDEPDPRRGREADSGETDADDPSAVRRTPAARHDTPRLPRIVHTGAQHRAVRFRHWELTRGEPSSYPITFYADTAEDPGPTGRLEVLDQGHATLTIDADRAGIWKAAICDTKGEQIGWLEIEV